MSEAMQTGAPAVADGDLHRRAAMGALLVGVRGVAVRILGVAGNVVLARLLLPSEFGTVALALSLLMLASVLFDGGLGASLIRRPREPLVAELRNVMGLQLVGATVITAGVFVGGLLIGGAGTVAAVTILALPLMALRGVAMIMLERRLSFGVVATVEVGEVLAYYGWAVVTVVLGYGIWGLATASIVKALVGTATLIRLAPEGFIRPAFVPAEIRALMRFGAQVQVADVVRVLRDQGLNLLTFAIAGAATLGLWTLATRVLQIPLLLFEALWRVSFPAMSQVLAAGDDVKPLMERAVRVIAATTGLITTVLACSAPALVPAVFGSRWAEAAGAIAIASLGIQIQGPISAVASGYLFAIDRAAVVARSAVAQAIVWLATSVALLPVIGVTALGVGFLAAGVAEASIFSRALRQVPGASLIRPTIPTLAIVTSASAGGWLWISSLPPTLAVAVLGAAIGAAVYAIALISLQRALSIEVVRLLRAARRGVAARSRS